MNAIPQKKSKKGGIGARRGAKRKSWKGVESQRAKARQRKRTPKKPYSKGREKRNIPYIVSLGRGPIT